MFLWLGGVLMRMEIAVGTCAGCGTSGLPGRGAFIYRYADPPRWERGAGQQTLATAFIGAPWRCGACAVEAARRSGEESLSHAMRTLS